MIYFLAAGIVLACWATLALLGNEREDRLRRMHIAIAVEMKEAAEKARKGHEAKS